MKAIDLKPLQSKLSKFLAIKRPNPKVIMIRNAES